MLEKAADTLAENDNVEIAKAQMDNLFNLHYDRSLAVQSELRELSNKLTELQRKLDEVQADTSKLRRNQEQSRSLRVQLEASSATKAQLEVTYHVKNAYWIPYYDVRVNKGENAPNASLSLTYFGGIKQRSGEDWNDAKIMLSTAQPAESITPPKLGTLRASIKKEEPTVAYPYGGYGGGPAPAAAPAATTEALMYKSVVNECADNGNGNCLDYDAEAPQLQQQTSSADKQAFATTFAIPDRHTVPTGSDEHKVIIARLTFDATLHSDCFPSKSTNVFVSARVANNSTYPLLGGDASIYVDGAFSSKAAFSGAVTGDRFDLPLGVDEGIKVLYRPAREYHTKKNETNVEVKTHEQKIVLKNTKWNETTVLTVHEKIPLSTDASLTVNILAPELSNSANAIKTDPATLEPGARLDENNNLAWTVELAADAEKELAVKWEVQSPVNKTVEYNDEL
ncbi:Protein F37C4.5 a [Aphelenchoides avenae]|nr:Protein F37C4.5 a [Aphelenchus avenae]